MDALHLDSVSVSYGKVAAVEAVNLAIDSAGVTALVGSNGAGKSTIMKAVSGLLPIRGGSVTLFGERIDKLEPDDRVRRGLVLVPEGRRLFRRMSVADNLLMGAFLRTDKKSIETDLQSVLELLPDLIPKLGALAGQLSGGQQQMVAVGRALMAKPKVLMLDEPTIGLAPLIVKTIMQVLKTVAAEHGVGVLLVEQNAEIALDIAKRAYIIERGAITMEGEAEALKHDPRVIAAYLGI